MENALIGAQIGLSDANADPGTGFGSLDARSVDLILYGRLWGSSNTTDAVDGAAVRLRGTLGMVRADNLTGAI